MSASRIIFTNRTSELSQNERCPQVNVRYRLVKFWGWNFLQHLNAPWSRSPKRVSAQPRRRRHERLTTKHGGLWYHLWVRRRRGGPCSERRELAPILSGAGGYAGGWAHHSVSRTRLSGFGSARCCFVILRLASRCYSVC